LNAATVSARVEAAPTASRQVPSPRRPVCCRGCARGGALWRTSAQRARTPMPLHHPPCDCRRTAAMEKIDRQQRVESCHSLK